MGRRFGLARMQQKSQFSGSKRGQVELTFNWMYILVAGGVILLFFVGIVMRQKEVSEQRLSAEVLRILQSIFVGSGVSESTKNFIDTSGLQRYELQFSCEDGVSRFGIAGQGGAAEDATQPTFSPERLKSSRLILWSLPYKLPYKVSDLLFVTSDNTLYAVFGDDEFTAQFVKATGGLGNGPADEGRTDGREERGGRGELSFNVQSFGSEPGSYNQVSLGKLYQIRIVDVGGVVIDEDRPVPEPLKDEPDIKVTAVVISSDHSTARYFRKRGNIWKKWGEPQSIISIAKDAQKDAAAYAAIFAGSPDIYFCNMRKALTRLPLVTKIYAGERIVNRQAGGKLGELAESYAEVDGCRQAYLSVDKNLLEMMQMHMGSSLGCQQDLKVSNSLAGCVSLESTAHDIEVYNSDTLVAQGCLQLY